MTLLTAPHKGTGDDGLGWITSAVIEIEIVSTLSGFVRESNPRRDNYERDDHSSDHSACTQAEREAVLRSLRQPEETTAFAFRPIDGPSPRIETPAHQQLPLLQDPCFDSPPAVVYEFTRPRLITPTPRHSGCGRRA